MVKTIQKKMSTQNFFGQQKKIKNYGIFFYIIA